MLQFLNPSLLIGLAAVSLPVIVHLLSRRNHDVVAWGAMQFLELAPRARRRLRLEQLLLLLLRMSALALLALALARPAISVGGWLRSVSTQSRDVVLVIDGSYSMAWEGASETPHASAVDEAFRLLDELQPGDTVSLVDARQRPRLVTENPTRDFDRVRRELSRLPSPAGSSDLPSALFAAVELLRSATNAVRDVVVLTDGQVKAWRIDDRDAWSRFDALIAEQSVRPRLWTIDTAPAEFGDAPNISVESPTPARELAIVGVPLQIRAVVRASASDETTTRTASLEVDGLRLGEQTRRVEVPPQGETVVAFDYVPRSAGSQVVSVVVAGEDQLPYDDRAQVALSVSAALSVVLVDGDIRADPTESETFFASAALTPAGNSTPWIQTTITPPDQFDRSTLQTASVVVLANVRGPTPQQAVLLAEFVRDGGGLLVALGDRADAENYNRLLAELCATHERFRFDSIQTAGDPTTGGVSISGAGLAAPWLERFRADGADLRTARFLRYWRIAADAESAADDTPRILARWETGDPFLIETRVGRGRTLWMTAPIDADWGTLPTKADYVPFLHEMLFHLARSESRRNVPVGEILQIAIAPDVQVDELAFHGPDGLTLPATAAGNELQPLAQLTDTTLPGVYTLQRRDRNEPADTAKNEVCVVHDDRSESDLTALDASQRTTLLERSGVVTVEPPHDFVARMLDDGTRAEVGHMLLLACLLLLVAETLLTRHLVKGGHAEHPTETSDARVELLPAAETQHARG